VLQLASAYFSQFGYVVSARIRAAEAAVFRILESQDHSARRTPARAGARGRGAFIAGRFDIYAPFRMGYAKRNPLRAFVFHFCFPFLIFIFQA
jgi:hypothetical protein